jgi:nicotinate-nucleotide adenylyltransferase
MTTGLLGGAFDPPHLGHVALAQAAIVRFELVRLVVVPVGDAPHKQVVLPAETRFRLAHAAFRDVPRVVFSRIDMARNGPAYTVDTVKYAEKEWSDVIFLVGADQFLGFFDWKDPDEILEHARLGVATRPGYSERKLKTVLKKLKRPERVEFFEIPELPISSTAVRSLIAAEEPYEHLVPTAVADVIDELGLYLG